MPELSDNLTIDVTVGEFNDIVTHLQRSITWTQQTISKLVLQAKAQTTEVASAAPAEPPPPRANGADAAAPVRPRRTS